jgi:hypothetical protein
MKAKELAEKYGVTPMQIGKIRKEMCSDEDYCTKTREISDLGVSKINQYFEKRDDEILEPKFVRVQVLDPMPNPLFWYCKLLEKPVRKVRVNVPHTHRGLMRKNLIFKAQVINKGGEDFYRHEIIYQREIIRQERIKKVY